MVSKRNFIVIGGNSFIGSALFASLPNTVQRIRTSSTGGGDFIKLRLEEPLDYTNLPIRPNDVVFICAAISTPDISPSEYGSVFRINVKGTIGLIESVIARGGRCIFFSSDTVYGNHELPIDESVACHPLGDYASMKYEVESKFISETLFKSIRLSYVFARDDKFTQYLSECNNANGHAKIFHPFYRAIIYRDDVVHGLIKLALNWNSIDQSIINFGGPDIISRVEFSELLKKKYFKNLKLDITDPPPQFFDKRPRFISMKSPWLSQLLGRPARSISEAIDSEFSQKLNTQITMGE